MLRLALIGALLLAAPAALIAQEKDKKDKATPAATKSTAPEKEKVELTVMPRWEMFVWVFLLALIVFIIILLMGIRSELARLADKMSGTPPRPL